MANPTLFLWPQDTSREEERESPKPKPKRSGSKATRAPQRGLGVAQLERIRLQDREIQPLPAILPSIYEHQALLPPSPRYAAAPLAYAGSAPICYVPQLRVSNQGLIGYGPVSTSGSVLQEQYAMDRARIAAGSVLVPELPSNQNVAGACDWNHCELCVRRKRVMCQDLGFCGGSGVNHYFPMNEDPRMGWLLREKEIKEFDFFPQKSAGGSGGGDMGFEDQMVTPTSSASADADASNFVDLSLKLFYK